MNREQDFQSSLRHTIGTLSAALAIPLGRLAIRYSPQLRILLWRYIDRFLAWRPHSFQVRSHFDYLFEGNTADVIQRCIYYFGHWEPQVEAVLRYYLRPGDTFVDVGANVGYFSLLAARIVGPLGSVVAVEPCAETYERLVTAMERNRCSRVVRCVRAAASNISDTVTLYHGGIGNSGTASLVREAGGSEKVPCTPLSDLLTRAEIRSTKLIKIDVEGAELLVLKGMARMVPALPQDAALVLEINPTTIEQLPELFPGWRAYEILPRGGMDRYLRVNRYYGIPLCNCDEQIDVVFTRSVAQCIKFSD